MRLLTTWLLSMSIFFAVVWLVMAIFGSSGITWAFAVSWMLLATGAAFNWHRTRRSAGEQQRKPASGDPGSPCGPQ